MIAYEKVYCIYVFAIASISSFAQDFLVDGLGYSVIREGDCMDFLFRRE